MKLSNFRLIEVIGRSAIDWKFRATVSVTTGFIFKKVKTVEIYRSYGGFWCFVNTGRYTPNTEAEALERSFRAVQGRELEECEVSTQ